MLLAATAFCSLRCVSWVSRDLIRGHSSDLNRWCAHALPVLFQEEQPSPLGEAVAAARATCHIALLMCVVVTADW